MARLPKTTNEQLLDAMIRHQVGLMRFSGSLRKRVQALLDKTEGDVRRQLELRLGKISAQRGKDFGPVVTARLKVLEKMLRTQRTSTFEDIAGVWAKELRSLTAHERDFVAGTIQSVSPVKLSLALPSLQTLAALVTKKPFQGKVLSAWAKNIAEADLQRIMNGVRIGMVNGEGSAEIARRVLGSAKAAGTDGLTEITRRQMEAVTRTAVNFYSNEAKAALYEANSDIITEEMYVSTLDSRTTAICRSLDGERFPVGEGPRPPQHFNCRSVRVAIIDGTVIGDRPAVAASESQLEGLSKKDRRATINALTGQVPATTTYGGFLKDQTVEFQNDVLGVKKAALFRKGGLTLDKFVARNGSELTLDQLRQREAGAFKRAGL